MKIAALYDIHANIWALDAVLDELESVRPDVIVIGGDIAYGPKPLKTIHRIQSMRPQPLFVSGNADRHLVDHMDGKPFDRKMKPHIRRITTWCATHLGRDERDFLSSFRETVVVDHPRLGMVLFCHATPDSDEVVFSEITPSARIDHHFSDIEQSVVVCGHTHMQFDRQVGTTRVVNAGSVGKPYGRRGAFWLLLDETIEFRRTFFDFDLAAAAVRESGHPIAEDFAVEGILCPPPREEIIEWLEGRVE